MQIYLEHDANFIAGKPNNVVLLTTLKPVMGRTIDDGRNKPAIYSLYNFTMGEYLLSYYFSVCDIYHLYLKI
jgi:hypothetical protein